MLSLVKYLLKNDLELTKPTIRYGEKNNKSRNRQYHKHNIYIICKDYLF